MRMFSYPTASKRPRSTSRAVVRLAIVLSGALVAGLALVPAASAAPRHAGAVPNLSRSDCQVFLDDTFVAAYCAPGPGKFQAWALCQFGDNFKLVDGNIADAGAHVTSRATCQANWFVAAGDVNIFN